MLPFPTFAFTIANGPKGRTELKIGPSKAKNCAEFHGNLCFCVAPQKPIKNAKNLLLIKIFSRAEIRVQIFSRGEIRVQIFSQGEIRVQIFRKSKFEKPKIKTETKTETNVGEPARGARSAPA